MDESENWVYSRDGIPYRGKRSLVVTSVLTCLATVVVALRIYARAGIMKIMGHEDWAILVALAFAIVYLALVACQAVHGMGIHMDRLSPEVSQEQLKFLWAAIPQYNASLVCSKFSILFQYLRIFPSRLFRIVCYIVMAIVALYGTWAVVSGYVNCVPVAKFWVHSLEGHCLSFEAVWFFNASMNIATDLALLAMPMPLLSRLQLPRMQKFALMGVFAVGIFVIITSILRLYYLQRLSQHMGDTPYYNVGASYWTAAECNVAIICASLPLLRPIAGRFFPKLMGISSYPRRTTNKYYYNSNPSQRIPTDLFTRDRDRDYDLYSINVKPGEQTSHTSVSGIEVTTEMTQESTKHGEASSERRLVMDSSSSQP